MKEISTAFDTSSDVTHPFDVSYKGRIQINYSQSFYSHQRSFFVLLEDQIVRGQLSTWNEHLKRRSKANKNEWISLLREALDIFKGNVKGFAGVSDEDEIREGMMKMNMKNLLRETLSLIISNIKSGKAEEEQELTKAIRVGIEFSMAIGAVEFLMTELYDEFTSRNMEALFLQNLFPFILTGKFSVSEEILRKIIYFYKERKDYENLEKVLLCLNFDSEDLVREV